MKFFKEITESVPLLSRMALLQLWQNIKTNARNGGGGGKYKSALEKSGLSKFEVKKKLNPKELDSKDLILPYIQELWIKQQGRCFNTGMKLNEKYLFEGNQSILAPSIDRIDNSKGYTIGNLKIVMRGINRFKNVTKEDEFTEILKEVALSVVDKYNL